MGSYVPVMNESMNEMIYEIKLYIELRIRNSKVVLIRQNAAVCVRNKNTEC